MGDNELLELPAKAYGIDWENVLRDGGSFVENGRVWNPLKNDGDCMRLAVDLEISFCRNHEFVFAQLSADPSDPDQSWGFSEEILHDAFAATRRAIVRAAADIGKTK